MYPLCFGLYFHEHIPFLAPWRGLFMSTHLQGLHFGPVPWDNRSLLRSHSLWLSRYLATFYKKGLWMISDKCWCRLSPPRHEVPRQAAQTDQTSTSHVPSPFTCSYPGVSRGYLPGKIPSHTLPIRGTHPSQYFAPCSSWYFVWISSTVSGPLCSTVTEPTVLGWSEVSCPAPKRIRIDPIRGDDWFQCVPGITLRAQQGLLNQCTAPGW